MPPVKPMLARATREVPVDTAYIYEPKWDGFRCIVFRDGDEVELASRNTRLLTRYFPELIEPIRTSLPPRCVLDGELVVVGPGGLDFDLLGQRIHPAESRINRLASEIPASFVAFDLLALDDLDLRPVPFAQRRHALEDLLADVQPPLHLTPATTDPGVAVDWFHRFEGAGFDGVIAKPAQGAYEEDRRVLTKVKHLRSADVVVAGYRDHKDGAGVGSLLLGIFDADRQLHHVGVATSFTAARRAELRDELAPHLLRMGEPHPWTEWATPEAHEDGVRMPGAPHRWSNAKDHAFVPLRLDLVAEVAYEQLQGLRFRHPARFLRWRPDRTPESCTYDQLEQVAPAELAQVFAAG